MPRIFKVTYNFKHLLNLDFDFTNRQLIFLPLTLKDTNIQIDPEDVFLVDSVHRTANSFGREWGERLCTNFTKRLTKLSADC
jgi:hypothetical protein